MVIAIIFFFACVTHAFYAWMSIKWDTNNWQWHVLQWSSAGLFVLSGTFIGLWIPFFTWHYLGEIVAGCMVGIIAYVIILHQLLRRD